MTRRILGFASLLLTLLAGGCQQMRVQRADGATAKAPAPLPAAPIKSANSLDPLPPPPDNLPKTLPPIAADAAAKWPFTAPPPPNPDHIASFPKDSIVPTVANAKPLIETAEKHPIVLMIECILDNRHDEAMKHMQKYDARTQDLLLHLLPPLSLIAKNDTLSAADIDALGDQLSSTLVHLQQNSGIAISRMCFCKTIKDFANYKPLPPEHEFLAALPGRSGERIELYVAFKNFASLPNSQGEFESNFSSHVEILDDKGKARWAYEFLPKDLKLVNRIRLGEYYHHYGFSVPDTLPPGSYTLVVTMTDETVRGASRTTDARLPLRIVASKDQGEPGASATGGATAPRGQ